MSSGATRNQILNYLKTNWTITPVFNLSDYLGRSTTLDVTTLTAWVAVQFLSADERFAGVGVNCYIEEGVIVLHVVMATGRPSSEAIFLCDQLSALFRGQRINDIVIMAIDPPTDQRGEALEFDGNWHGFAMYLDYYRQFGV